MVLECLKHLEQYAPEDAKAVSQRVWQEFADAAEVDQATLKLALRRIYIDGYNGPVSDADWEACEGEAMPLSRAKDIVRAAMSHNPDIRYHHPDHGWMCEGEVDCNHQDHRDLDDPEPLFHCSEIHVDPETIKRECFDSIYRIYGGPL